MSTENHKARSVAIPGIEADELIVDNFAGGGGASTGIELALGRPVDIAINHDPEAIAMHAMNHPHTLHLCENVWKVDIAAVVAGRKVGIVTVHGIDYQIVDIGMRMLSPRELFRAQGFPDGYVIERGRDPQTGAEVKLTKTAQVRMCGNSVSPPPAEALVRAQFFGVERARRDAA